jgi:hypothetical protein
VKITDRPTGRQHHRLRKLPKIYLWFTLYI